MHIVCWQTSLYPTAEVTTPHNSQLHICHITLVCYGYGVLENSFNTLMPRRDLSTSWWRYLNMFLNENAKIWITIALEFASMGPFHNAPSLVYIMTWCWTWHELLLNQLWLSLFSLLTHHWNHTVACLLLSISTIDPSSIRIQGTTSRP